MTNPINQKITSRSGTIFGLAALLAVSLPVALHAADSSSILSQWEDRTERILDSNEYLRAGDVSGWAVYTGTDNRLGRVQDLIVDAESGEITHLVVSKGGIFGIGATDRLTTIDQVRFAKNDERVMLNIDEQAFDRLPEYDADRYQGRRLGQATASRDPDRDRDLAARRGATDTSPQVQADTRRAPVTAGRQDSGQLGADVDADARRYGERDSELDAMSDEVRRYGERGEEAMTDEARRANQQQARAQQPATPGQVGTTRADQTQPRAGTTRNDQTRMSDSDRESRSALTRGDREKAHAGKRASDLLGKDLVDSSGESIGRIDDLLISNDGKNVEYAVLSLGGFVGIAGSKVAVPLSALNFDHAGEQVHIPVSRDALQNSEESARDWFNNLFDS